MLRRLWSRKGESEVLLVCGEMGALVNNKSGGLTEKRNV